MRIAPVAPGLATPGGSWRDELGIALVLSVLAASCVFGGWAWRLDRLVYDLGLRLWRLPPPADVLIVAIDDASIQAIGRWPWHRAVHATLLERLAAARPRAVALDLVLSEPDPDPAQDRWLAAALAHAAPVVVPVAWQTADAGRLQVLQPTEALRAAVTLGAAEPTVDADGVLRHAFLHAGPQDALYPHVALALLQAGGEGLLRDFPADAASPGRVNGGQPAAGVASRMDATGAAFAGGMRREGLFAIRFTGPPGSVERVSYVDVLRGAVPAERLAGRYLLVGMTAQGLGDTLATPVNGRHQSMPGIEVLAQTLATLRSGNTVRTLPDTAAAALSAAAVLALLLALARASPRWALPAALLSVPLAVAASLLALRSGIWCSPVPYSLAATLAYPLWSWRRLERAVAGLDREIVRWNVDAAPSPSPPLSLSLASAAHSGDTIAARLHTLHQAGTVVRMARQFLADALAAMPTAMLVADGGARVVLANERAAALFGVDSSDDLLGLDLQRLLAELATSAPMDWHAALAALQPGSAGLAIEGRLAVAARPDAAGGTGSGGGDQGDQGDQGDHVVHVAAVDLQGQRRFVVTLADLQPVKQAERDREEALAFVSHDLRSPATSIVLLADLQLRGGGAAVPQATLLHDVRRLALRTLELSDDFVRAAQARRQPLQQDAVAVAAWLHAVLTDLQPQAEAGGVRLAISTPAADTVATFDGRLVARAVANLVSNAIKHSPRGSTVRVSAMHGGGQLQLQVRDHGPGLVDAQLRQLAQGGHGLAPGDARDAHGSAGVGLGLLFVQRVAQRHGGVLLAAAAPQGGALFTLQLPA